MFVNNLDMVTMYAACKREICGERYTKSRQASGRYIGMLLGQEGVYVLECIGTGSGKALCPVDLIGRFDLIQFNLI